jgi:hypothetical protein
VSDYYDAKLADQYEQLAISAHLRATNSILVFTGSGAYCDSAEYWREAARLTPPTNPCRAFRADRAQIMSWRAAQVRARELGDVAS